MTRIRMAEPVPQFWKLGGVGSAPPPMPQLPRSPPYATAGSGHSMGPSSPPTHSSSSLQGSSISSCSDLAGCAAVQGQSLDLDPGWAGAWGPTLMRTCEPGASLFPSLGLSFLICKRRDCPRIRKPFLMSWDGFASRSQASDPFSLEEDWSLVLPSKPQALRQGRGTSA